MELFKLNDKGEEVTCMSNEEIEKICYKNVLRVYKEVLK